jgi:acyl-CoA synthetase (AMP-forming)/AMP-acid ligase II
VTVDVEGHLKLLGRIDNLIKCACESIQPAEIEDILLEHPEIDKVCIIGVADERLYQKVCACIILKASHHDNKEVLCAKFEDWCKGKFYETTIGLIIKPHYFVFIDSFPLTRTGKLNRRILREIASTELGIKS